MQNRFDQEREDPMKILWLTLVFFFSTDTKTLLGADPTGREIMERHRDLHAADSERIEEEMVLVDRKGHEETRKVRSFSKKNVEGTDRALIVFLSPAANGHE